MIELDKTFEITKTLEFINSAKLQRNNDGSCYLINCRTCRGYAGHNNGIHCFNNGWAGNTGGHDNEITLKSCVKYLDNKGVYHAKD